MTTQQDLLFELGTEELPPKSLKTLRDTLLAHLLNGFNEAGLTFDEANAYAAPRRLAVLVRNLSTSQPDKTVEKRGPAIQAAFASDGTPSKAAVGFAASCGTSFEQLERLKTDKGEWLVFKQNVQGQATASLLPDLIRQSLNALPIAKRMRWGNGAAEFARPVHWVVLLFGEQVIETEILGLHTCNQSRGHRFHAPQAITIPHPLAYLETLQQQGQVVADFEQRKTIIREAAQQTATKLGGVAYIEEDLLDEIAALNEWPVPVTGHFDARFLELPMEVLITSMQTNQKYFPVKNADGGLLPFFITFSNIASTNPQVIAHGNERVILPRLADAEFFWKQDRKQPLAERTLVLADVVFQKDLGSLADKTRRVIKLSEHIAACVGADAKLAERAALLCKADLLTSMVGEFANLQGIMGHYYALADGEAPEVAQAIEEHYFPKQSGGATPTSVTGQILSLAEKLDTLTGIFSVGLIPTGDKDPYALRRATLGILRILIENRLPLDVVELLATALAQFGHHFDKAETQARVSDFVFDRLKGYCLDKGYSADEFEAVLSVKPTKPLDFMLRLQAVKAFRALPEAESLAAANKRISNILKKSDEAISDSIGELVEAAEKALLAQATASAADIAPLLAQADYTAALSRLAGLRGDVDAFFDGVMVNCEDAALRRSRLALLAKLSNQFLQIADIGKLQA